MYSKLGFITVGQSPRVDVVPEMAAIIGEKVQIIETGALDGLTKEQIDEFAPEEGDIVLASRMADGTGVVFAEKYIFPRLQGCIDKLQENGVSYIVFICTGDFEYDFKHNIPLIFPGEILKAVVPSFLSSGKFAVLSPDEKQIPHSYEKWGFAGDPYIIAANPYQGIDSVLDSASQLKNMDLDCVIMDCIGYTMEMQKAVKETLGVPVFNARSTLARMLSEIL